MNRFKLILLNLFVLISLVDGVTQRPNVIVVGTGENSKYVTEKLLNHGQKLYNVIGTIKADDEINGDIESLIINLGNEKDIKVIISKNPVSDIVIALDNMDHEHVMKLISTININQITILDI